METTAHLRQLDADGARFAATARAADLDAPVPGLEWTVRDVVAHTGGVHRWVTDLVGRRRTSNETGGSRNFWPDLPDDELADWFVEGHATLVATLADTPDDVGVWGFGPQVPARAFWSRRRAHETAVHRADVEAGAGGAVTGVDAEFAQDGLAELVAGFARGRGFATAVPGRLALLADDGDDWLVTFGGERIVGSPAAADELAGADATVSGTSSDLYRWVWNRPSPAVVTGDPGVVDLWRQVRIG